ncbi:hypothetical protein ACTG9Q_14970 [Actinokineospora sp. 24-640]
MDDLNKLSDEERKWVQESLIWHNERAIDDALSEDLLKELNALDPSIIETLREAVRAETKAFIEQSGSGG